MSAQPPPAGARRQVYLLFFLSGASGLILETLWTYQATLALGSSYWAVTAVLSAFMGGLALGNLVALRRPRFTLSTYAALEGVILVTGFAALGILPQLGRWLAPAFGALADHAAALNGLRFAIAFGVLAVPSTAMGMTLPALVQALGGDHGSFRPVLGRLYGLNTAGAIGGVLAAEFVLLPAAGVYGAGAFAALLSGAAALGAWRIARNWALGGGSSAPEPAREGAVPSQVYPAFLAVFLAGFALLALEVIWTRFLSLFVLNSSLAFALMLATVLSGIALGGLAGGTAWIRKESGFLVLFGAAVGLVVCYAGAPFYLHSPRAPFRDTAAVLGVGLVLQFPVSFLSGAFFTISGAAFRERMASSQAAAGLLALWNTLGAAVGAVVAGILLVPKLGIEASFFSVAVLYGLAALAWYRVTGSHPRRLAAGAAAWIAALALFPFGQFERRDIPASAVRWAELPETKIRAYREGLAETLIYIESDAFGRPCYYRMLSNSLSMSCNNVPADRYMKEFVYWPVAVHPHPRSALLICFGVGSTARALTRTRELDRIDMVDLSRDVLEMSDVLFPDAASHPLKDPRVKVHVEDGRFFLQTRSERWDIITGEPPPPSVPGVAGLYSREYFRLLRERLSEGGIATYWLPIHDLSEPASKSILKSWSQVFETCFLWRGSNRDLLLVGIRGSLPRPDLSRFEAQWKDPATRADLADVGFDVPEALGTGFVGDGDYIRSITADAEPTLDAFPKRIVDPGTGTSRLYESWFDLEACRRRFGESLSLAALWPPELRSRTMALFPWEGALGTPGAAIAQPRFPDFSLLYRLSTNSPLGTPAVWLLGSDRDLQRAAREAPPPLQAGARAQFHLGVGAIARRDYADASEHLLRAVGGPEMRRVDLAACLYALCMAGRRPDAERTLAGVWDAERMKAIPSVYWDWMHSTFGMKTPR